MSGHELPALLTAAAVVLERAGEIGPVSVRCDRASRSLPPVTITPASVTLPGDVQRAIVRTIAEAMGWRARPLDGEDGTTTRGQVGAIEVDALAVPLPGHPVDRPGPCRTTTAAHADLLRALAGKGGSSLFCPVNCPRDQDGPVRPGSQAVVMPGVAA
ncbi:hypothetical protein ACGFNU_39280 [Spirillospora sp. NPDC048911]|uniref:hypothetical protein n=1 Tax=Spirillospora sp. NPDC048911 TaxID=3364527 RepID=UPI003721DA12